MGNQNDISQSCWKHLAEKMVGSLLLDRVQVPDKMNFLVSLRRSIVENELDDARIPFSFIVREGGVRHEAILANTTPFPDDRLNDGLLELVGLKDGRRFRLDYSEMDLPPTPLYSKLVFPRNSVKCKIIEYHYVPGKVLCTLLLHKIANLKLKN